MIGPTISEVKNMTLPASSEKKKERRKGSEIIQSGTAEHSISARTAGVVGFFFFRKNGSERRNKVVPSF